MALDLGRIGAGIAGEQNQAMQGYGDARSANAYGQAGAINQGIQGLLGAGMSIYGQYGGGSSAPYSMNDDLRARRAAGV
jgi:hypothetical protein